MTTKTIIRAPKGTDRPYVATRRKTAQDDHLSFEARGVLWYLLSKPDDWEVDIADIQKQGGIGRNKVYRILKELKAHGYLKRHRRQAKDGTFTWGPYQVIEAPDEPCTENGEMDTGEESAPSEPYPQNPYMENGHNIHNRESTERTSAPTATESPDVVPDSATSDFWRVVQADIVDQTYHGNARMFGGAGDLAHVVCGTATKAPYAEYNVEGMTPDEWEAIKLWHAATRATLNWPRAPQKWNQLVHDFRHDQRRLKFIRQVAERHAPPDDAPALDEMVMADALSAVTQKRVA